MKRYDPGNSCHEKGFAEGGDQQRSREEARGDREEPHVEELMKKYGVLGRRVLARRLAGDCNHRLVHQRFQGALGVDHPRDEVQKRFETRS